MEIKEKKVNYISYFFFWANKERKRLELHEWYGSNYDCLKVTNGRVI